jgi:Protein of unknown function C-terminus (DUF2399)/Phenazine biosynthesis-like protein
MREARATQASKDREGIEQTLSAEIPFALYDSFARRPFGGNVAGVVVVHPLPSGSVMQAVAAELAAPTTGFVDATDAGAPTVRFFTPHREIDACGHVSLAVAVELTERGEWPVGNRGGTKARPDGPAHLRQRPPGAAATVLLRQLAAAGARLRYHGDFDWPGTTIANGIIGRLGARPWRLDSGAYRSAAALGGASLRGRPVTAAWDPPLTAAMLEVGVKVEEERVLGDLLADLAG